MPRREDDPVGGPDPDNPDPTNPPPPSDPMTYTYIRTDAAGTQVFQGSDGKEYKFANSGPFGFEYVPYTAPPATPDTPPPGGGGSGGGDLTSPFGGHFTAPPGSNFQMPDTPVFTPPGFTPPPAFSAPTADDVYADPSYKFRLGEGQRALEASAAGRGTLRSGGTLGDILKYGQQFASNEYGNVFNRNLDTYKTNFETQYRTPYEFAYKSALDQFSPKLLEFQLRTQTGQRNSENIYDRAWQQYLEQFREWQDQRDSTFDKRYKTSTA